MPIKPLPASVILSEFSDTTNVWFAIRENTPEEFLLTPDMDDKDFLWLFTKQGDAEHFCFLLNELAPAFKEEKVMITSDFLGNIVPSAVQHKQLIAIIPPNEAKEYFETEYPEYMSKYFGM